MNDEISLKVRVFVNGGLKVQEETVHVRQGEEAALLQRLAERHAKLLAKTPGYVELEFLDELDPQKRFFRMGTDASQMVDPIAVDLTRPASDVLRKWGRKPQ